MTRCFDCANWKTYSDRALFPEPYSGMTGTCAAIRAVLDIELHHPPYAGGSSVESIDTPFDFGCSLFVEISA